LRVFDCDTGIVGRDLRRQKTADDLLDAVLAFDADGDDVVVGSPHAAKL
jgi:hypothetical protein